MSEVKARLVGAITVMDESMASRLWEIVESMAANKWDSIEEEVPDEIDLQMIRDAESDPDCRVIAE